MFPLNKKKITHFFSIKIVYVQVDGGEKKKKKKNKGMYTKPMCRCTLTFLSELFNF